MSYSGCRVYANALRGITPTCFLGWTPAHQQTDQTEAPQSAERVATAVKRNMLGDESMPAWLFPGSLQDLK